MDSMGLGKQISLQLAGAAHRVIEVSPGKSFSRLRRDRYLMRPANREDFDALIGDIRKRGTTPQNLMHLWSVSDDSLHSTDEILSLSFYSLLHLAQALHDHQLAPMNITVVSNLLQSVLGESVHAPVRSTLLGPTRVISKELVGIKCRSIDCDPAGQGTDYTAVQIIAEHCSTSSDPVVAYRGEDRWVERIEPWKLRDTGRRVGLKQGGAYVIAGGLADSGLAIAKNFAANFHARVALVDNVLLPPREQWNEVLLRSDTPEPVKQAIGKVIEIQSVAGEVLTIRADLARPEETKRAINLAEAAFGRIDGVVYVADVAEDCPLRNESTEKGSRRLSSKVQGVLALGDLLKDQGLDFFALFDSGAFPIPSAGQINSAAVNGFLEAFAKSRRDIHAVTVHSQPAASAISSSQAADVLVRILAADAPSAVIISSDNLLEKEPGEQRDTPQMVGKDDVEATLRGWWLELLGLQEVDLDDDFFELGGHSLIGVLLFSKIKKTYDLDLGLATLFEARTVRELAQLIRKTTDAPQNQPAEPKPWSPLVPIQPRGSRPPLYVISGLGGNVVKFHSLSFHLGEDQPIFGLLPRGLDGKDSYHTSVEDIAADYVKAIRAKQPKGPYRLIGYSFGGIVAFEVAQQIVAQGEEVSLLGLLDTLERHYGERIDESVGTGSGALKEHLKEIFAGPNGYGYLMKLLSARSFKIKYRVLRALGRPLPKEIASIEEVNLHVAKDYRPKQYPGKLVLFRSMKRSVTDGSDEMLGWGALAGLGVEVRDVPSTHFNMLQEPAVKALAEQLHACLQS